MDEAGKEFSSELPGSDWRSKIDVRGLSYRARASILDEIRKKLGFNKACRELGISKSSLHRYLTGKSRIPDDVISKALKHLDEEEFFKIVKGTDKLIACRIIGEDDNILDISAVSQLIALASRNEYLKQMILKFVQENLREELNKMRDIYLTGIRLKWSDDFESFLRERKKGRKITTDEMIKKYRSYFKKYIEGKRLSYELVEQIAKHKIGWVRNIFRHYIRYLRCKGKISADTRDWILEIVPGRAFKTGVRPYQISLEDVKRTIEFLKNSKNYYYIVYRLMLESGIRFTHALELLSTWNADEFVYIKEIELETKRLVCFEDKGFCRYYLGVRRVQKTCDWVYFSIDLLEQIIRVAPLKISRSAVTKYAQRHGLVRPKMIRKFAWRHMIKVMDRAVSLFIQSRYGELELETTKAVYEDLLSEADEQYPRYLEHIRRLIIL